MAEHPHDQQAAAPAAITPDTLATVYDTLIQKKIYASQLAWGRLQTLIAIQGAVLSASYALRGSWMAIALLLVGAALSLILAALAWGDIRDHVINDDVIDEVLRRIIPADIRRPDYVDARAGWRLWLRGRDIVLATLVGFALLDVALTLLLPFA